MARLNLSVRAILLLKEPSAGGYERLSLLSAEEGLLTVLRRSAAAKTLPPADLFDLCSVGMDARQGGAWFLREYVVERRHAGLAARFEALEAASLWVRLLLANLPHMEEAGSLFALTVRALDAWEQGLAAGGVLLKALYLFARQEGLPVRQEWLPSLGGERGALAVGVLGAELDAGFVAGADGVALSGLCEGLLLWMCSSHHILPPRKLSVV